jgi:hypothetical protein
VRLFFLEGDEAGPVFANPVPGPVALDGSLKPEPEVDPEYAPITPRP